MTDKPAGDLPPVTPPAAEPPAEKEKELTAAELALQLADMRKALKDANRESADRRKKLEAFEAAEAERKTAEMTETQKLQARLDKLEAEKTQTVAQANERIITAELKAQAAAQGFTDLDYAVFKVRAKVTLTEAGDVEGAEDALKELAKASPALVKKAGAAPLNPGNPANGQTGETLAQQRARVYGSGASNLFDVKTAYEQGGGVIMDPQSPKQQP